MNSDKLTPQAPSGEFILFQPADGSTRKVSRNKQRYCLLVIMTDEYRVQTYRVHSLLNLPFKPKLISPLECCND